MYSVWGSDSRSLLSKKMKSNWFGIRHPVEFVGSGDSGVGIVFMILHFSRGTRVWVLGAGSRVEAEVSGVWIAESGNSAGMGDVSLTIGTLDEFPKSCLAF